MADTPVSMTLSTEVAEAVRIRDAATPGPWFTRESKVYSLANVVPVAPLPDSATASFAEIPYTRNDCKLIAAAPSHVDLIERLHARVRELVEGKDYGPFERQINDLQMQNANCVKENLRLRAELEQARAKLRDCIPIAGTKTARMKP